MFCYSYVLYYILKIVYQQNIFRDCQKQKFTGSYMGNSVPLFCIIWVLPSPCFVLYGYFRASVLYYMGTSVPLFCIIWVITCPCFVLYGYFRAPVLYYMGTSVLLFCIIWVVTCPCFLLYGYFRAPVLY